MRLAASRPSFAGSPLGILALALPISLAAGLLPAQQNPGNIDTVRFAVDISPNDLVVEKIPLVWAQYPLTRVRLKGADATSEPGLPVVPLITRQVAMPPGAQVLAVREAARQPNGGQPRTIPDVLLLDWDRGPQPLGNANQPVTVPEFPQGPNGSVYHPLERRASQYDPLLLQAPLWPPQVASLGSVRRAGVVQLVSVNVAPVQWSWPDAALLVRSHLEIEVDIQTAGPIDIANASYADRQALAAARNVAVNRDSIPDPSLLGPLEPETLDAWYLIITDNQKWLETKRPGLPLPGDMVRELQRLADWKTAKGVKAAVVTVADILGGRYGSFKAGAVDTQEVIRNFLKHAHRNWGTYWVLLGGDVDVIPIRQAAGSVSAIPHVTVLKKDENGAVWLSDAEQVQIRHLQGAHVGKDDLVSTRRSGKLYRRVANPTPEDPGWSYVTEDFRFFTGDETNQLVIVGAPGDAAELAVTDFYPLSSSFLIPTDLYYASLESPLYDRPGFHDWDLVPNGVYGQHDGTTSIDGVEYSPTIALGRAPVASGDEARSFVDKVIAYELHDGLASEFGGKILLDAALWGTGPWVARTDTSPPEEGKYFIASFSATTAWLHFKDIPPVPEDYDLVCQHAGGVLQRIPYNEAADASTLGYWFAEDDTYSSVSLERVDPIWGGVSTLVPRPTYFVVVRGPASSIYPGEPGSGFFWEHRSADGSVLQKEDVKEVLHAAFPELDPWRLRRYQDWQNTPGYPAADLGPLSPTDLQDQLSTGFNLVSLTGHGWWGGCCGLQESKVGYDNVRGLTNGKQGGLVYADSCETLQLDFRDPDGNRCMGEVFLQNARGGAIAYIGNTRWSWIGQGSRIEKHFWETLARERRLGNLHNTKADLLDNDYTRWASLALNLLGDPEMPLWTGAPDELKVTVPPCTEVGSDLAVRVAETDGTPINFAAVCVTGPDGFFRLRFTGLGGASPGTAIFSTAGLKYGDDAVVTVTVRDHIPFQGRSRIGLCGLLFVRGDANGDHRLDIADPISILTYLFSGGAPLRCLDAADSNDDGRVDIADSVKLLGYLFTGDHLPAGTTPNRPQEDATPDNLGCAAALQ